jgi:hypothetical protein
MTTLHACKIITASHGIECRERITWSTSLSLVHMDVGNERANRSTLRREQFLTPCVKVRN